ncbi:MAG: hypothetical protein V4864_10525 [Pseudomonadota bacterium]
MTFARPLLRALPDAAASPLARHRAFLGLRAVGGGARAGQCLSPLERVLRRTPRPVVRHTALLLQAFHLWRSQRHLHVQNLSARHVSPVRQMLLVRIQQTRANAAALQARHTTQHPAFVPQRPDGEFRPRNQPAPALARRAEAALPAVLRRAEARAAYPRVGTALARPPAARAADAQTRPQHADFPASAGGHDALRAPRNTPAAGPDWTLPPRELARVAASVSHQVIGQLERRALSLRERSGRV